jgi:hypothetical protein
MGDVSIDIAFRTRTLLRIILDSNLFISRQFDLTAPDFQALARAAGLGVATLIVPEIVVAEVERKFRDLLIAETAKIAKAEGNIHRMTQRAPSPTVDVVALCSEFSERFSKWRSEHKVIVLSTSIVSSDALVQRALKRLKPFKGTSDEGMRDAIIWESLLWLAAEDKEEIALVSQNTHDFADSSGTALHPDLLAEPGAVGDTEVTYFPDIRALREVFLEEAITEAQEEDDLEAAKTFAGKIKFDELYGPQIVEALEDSLVESLPAGFDSPSVPHLDPPDKIIVEEAVGLEPRKVEVTLALEFEIQAEGFASKGDAYRLTDEPGISIDSWDWNEWTSTMTYVDKAYVDVSVVVDASGPSITGFQVNDVGWGRYNRE